MQTFPRALARHLHQSERRHGRNLVTRVIALKRLFEHGEYVFAMRLLFHINEVDDDDAAKISQPELPCDSHRGLEIGPVDRFLEVAMADVGARVDVDRRHRFRLVEDKVSAGLQGNIPVQRLANLVLDGMQVEYRAPPLVVLQPLLDAGQEGRGEFVHCVEVRFRIDQNGFHVTRCQIAQHSQRQRQVLVYQLFYATVPAPLLNDTPEPDQVFEVGLQRITAGALGDRPHDRTALEAMFLQQFLDDEAQTFALAFLVDARRNSHAGAPRQQDQVARRQRNKGRQPRALVAQRVLDDLHQQAIAFSYQFPYVPQFLYGGLSRFTVSRNVRRVQECRTIEADVHECCLHPGKHARHLPIVDIADQSAARGPFDEDFLQYPVFEQRRPGFRRRHIDQDLLFSRLVAHIASFSSAGGSMPAARSSSAVSSTGRPTTPV